jgi:hypothetical protein
VSEKVIIGNATRPHAIYAFEEHDGEVRYVGKTSQYLIDRRKAHLRPKQINGPLPVNRWLKKRRDAGVGFVTRLIEHVPCGQDWAAREKYWIAYYRQQGNRMLNLTDGGEGLCGHVFSQEHREKISKALRTGKECPCLHCGKVFWRKRNEIEKGNAKYCSKSCYQIAQKGVSKASTVPESAISAAAEKRRAMTHCKRGHELSGVNLFFTSTGGRGCKECRKLHKKAYRERTK